jgi:hypothetical protein
MICRNDIEDGKAGRVQIYCWLPLLTKLEPRFGWPRNDGV